MTLTLKKQSTSEVRKIVKYRKNGSGEMKKKRYTEEQTSFALKQAEYGTPVEEVCRKLGISEQTFYRWKKQYAGVGPQELRRLRQLEEENSKLNASHREISFLFQWIVSYIVSGTFPY